MLEALEAAGFDILVSNHGAAILTQDFSDELAELQDALLGLRIPAEERVASGGGEAPSTQRLRRALADKGWLKHNFVLETKIDGVVRESVSHEIDHIRRAESGTIALEIEWNNKDPFFDRDLENFQRLHAISAISIGIVVTRGAALQSSMYEIVRDFIAAGGYSTEQELIALGMKARTARQRLMVRDKLDAGEPFSAAFARPFVNDKFGEATTHWRKLADRVKRGVGNPCPLLLLGLPRNIVGF